MFNFLLDLIFPPRCAHCRVIIPRGRALCENCRMTIQLHETLFCGSCHGRLPLITHRFTLSLSKGSSLASLRSPCHPSFPYILAPATDYSNATKSLIHALKFEGLRDAGAELGALMALYMNRLPLQLEGACIVPVPLSRRRMNERGYNQAELIASCLSEKLASPVIHALKRVRSTQPQSQTGGAKARAENVFGCFEALLAAEDLQGKTILLIDDVVTSGATLHEAAKALKEAGVGRILAVVGAKA